MLLRSQEKSEWKNPSRVPEKRNFSGLLEFSVTFLLPLSTEESLNLYYSVLRDAFIQLAKAADPDVGLPLQELDCHETEYFQHHGDPLLAGGWLLFRGASG